MEQKSAKEEKKSGSSIRDIRTYIMGLMYRNNFTSLRVPSSPELAKMFSVTRRTARMALEGLIAEGFLIGRQGVGTFTNPKIGFRLSGAKQRKLIAVGDGKCNTFYYDLRIGKTLSSLICNICEAGHNVHNFSNMPDEPAPFSRALAAINPDAVIIYNSELAPEAISDYLKAKNPCVMINRSNPSADIILYDYYPAYCSILEEMRERGKKHLLLFNHRHNEAKLAQAIKDIYPECIYTINDTPASDDQYYTDLEELFAVPEKTPDYLVCSWRAPEVICDLREKYGVSPERCRAVVDGDYVYCERYQGGYIAPDRDETSRTAIRMVEERWKDSELPQQIKSIPINYIKEKKTRWEEK